MSLGEQLLHVPALGMCQSCEWGASKPVCLLACEGQLYCTRCALEHLMLMLLAFALVISTPSVHTRKRREELSGQ